MEKQDKVIKKIKGLGTGSKLNLGTKQNDECYTDMNDIVTELSHYAEAGRFKGKNIICPCDWDITDDEEIYSITITYKDLDVEVISNNIYKAVKSVYYDLWSDDSVSTITRIELKEDEIEDFLANKLTCNFLRTLTQNARVWGIKSITASGYNPANGKGVKFQDVDYSKYDICITNPPFSLLTEFLNGIVGIIDFIILAPFTKRGNPCYGVYLMTKQAYLGFSGNSDAGYIAMNFINPTKENQYHTLKVPCDWLTSFPDAQLERNKKHFKSGIKYEDYKDEYIVYINTTMKDGTHPIKVPSDAFPEDYDGWMCTAVNVLNKLDDSYEWYGTHFAGYFNKEHPELSPFAHKCSDYMLSLPNLGKTPFSSIIFRKKPVKENNNE